MTKLHLKPCPCGDPKCKRFIAPPLIEKADGSMYREEMNRVVERYNAFEQYDRIVAGMPSYERVEATRLRGEWICDAVNHNDGCDNPECFNFVATEITLNGKRFALRRLEGDHEESAERTLALLALQSDRYGKDPEFRDAVDDVLLKTSNRAPLSRRRERCANSKHPGSSPVGFQCTLRKGHAGPCDYGPAYHHHVITRGRT